MDGEVAVAAARSAEGGKGKEADHVAAQSPLDNENENEPINTHGDGDIEALNASKEEQSGLEETLSAEPDSEPLSGDNMTRKLENTRVVQSLEENGGADSTAEADKADPSATNQDESKILVLPCPTSLGKMVQANTEDGGTKTEPSYQAGMEVLYKNAAGIQGCTILNVHLDDLLEPYYTIRLEDGREKQTDTAHIMLAFEDGIISETKQEEESEILVRETDAEAENMGVDEPAGREADIKDAPSGSPTVGSNVKSMETDESNRQKEEIRGDEDKSSGVEQTLEQPATGEVDSAPPEEGDTHKSSAPLPSGEGSEHDPQTNEATLVLDREILFDDGAINIQAFDDGSAEARQKVQGWTNQQWNAASGKVLTFYAPVLRVMPGRFFWSADDYDKRILAIYNNPDVVLVMRLPKDKDEVRRLASIGNLELSQQELHAFLVVDSVADPKTCKIRLSQLTNPTSVPGKDLMQSDGQGLRMNMPKKNDRRRQSCFDLLTPTETITLSAAFLPPDVFDDIEYTSEKSLNDTMRFEDAIVSLLIKAHSSSDTPNSGADQAWKHQVVLGTLQSYVISGNDSMLKQSLASAIEIQKSRDKNHSDMVDSVIIDAKDECGKSALHWACNRRKHSTIQLLVSAGANCSLAQNADELTPCHICALGLDEKGLSLVLSAATTPTRPDPNALDCEFKTPMYLAAVKGKGVNGNSNAIALGLCLTALESWGGQLVVDHPKSSGLLHPVHCISIQWRPADLSVVLSHCNHRYPLTSIGGSDPDGMSLSAKFQYPLHAALVSLRMRIASAFEERGDSCFNAEFMPLEPALVKTLRTLLEHGSEPNERLEGIIGEGGAIKSFSCYFGFSPLQILALSAADARSIELKKQETGEDDVDTIRMLRNMKKVIQDSAELLLKNGGRMNMPPPPVTRLDRPTPTGCYSLEEALEDQNASMQVGYREAGWLKRSVTIDGSNKNSVLLGGADRLKTSQKAFAAMGKSVKNIGDLIKIGSSLSLDSGAPGGSDILSCAICWSEFGVIQNRKHLCRVSCRYVCNECSTKRLVVENGSEQRISDGQYLLATAEVGKAAANSQANREEQMQKQRQSVTQARKALGLKRTSGSNSSADTEANTKLSTKEKITNAISGLGQTKDAVLERGDKLESLADKTEALEQASLDFANMAKELNRSQNSWW